MKSLITRLFIIVCGASLLALPARAATTQDQKPKEADLQAIVDTLKVSKTTDNTGEMLDKAKKLLDKETKKPTRNKNDTEAEADCTKASKAIDEALDALKANDKDTMNQKIDHAVAMVKMAILAKERRN